MSDDIKVLGFCPMGCGQTLVATLPLNRDPDEPRMLRCSNEDCPRPLAPDAVFASSETEHIVKVTPEGWVAKHPLRERNILGADFTDLFDCKLTQWMEVLEIPPVGPGYYRVTEGDGGLEVPPPGSVISTRGGQTYLFEEVPDPLGDDPHGEELRRRQVRE